MEHIILCIASTRFDSHNKENSMRDLATITFAVVCSAAIYYHIGTHTCSGSDGLLADIGPHNSCKIPVKLGFQNLAIGGQIEGKSPPTYNVNWGVRQFELELGTPLVVDGYLFELRSIQLFGKPSVTLQVSKQESD